MLLDQQPHQSIGVMVADLDLHRQFELLGLLDHVNSPLIF